MLLLGASFLGAPSHAAVSLTPLDAFVVSHGYGGAQFVSVENTYRLPVKLNGTVGDLTIDTGAAGTVIFKARVKKFGLLATETKEPVNGVFGKSAEKLSIVTIPQLAMGNLTLMNVKAAVVSDWNSRALYRPYGLSDGLLGLPEMFKYGMVLDLKNHLLLAHPGGRVSAVSDGIRSILTSQGYSAVPLSVVAGHLQVPAVVNGTSCKLVVDTGAYFTVLDRTFARQARIGGYDTGLNAQGLGTNGRGMGYAHFDELRIGDLTIRSASVTITALNPEITAGKSKAAGLLGAEYLGLLGGVFDFNSNTLYLHPAKKK